MRGKVSGVNTLKHFVNATSRDLTLTVLRWAAQQPSFTATSAHTRLLAAFQQMVQDADVFSFEEVRAYLAAWSETPGIGSPRNALPFLGLLPDPNLFAGSTLLHERLEKNADLMAKLRDRTPGQMEAIRKRHVSALERTKNKSEPRALLKIFEKLEAIRRSPTPNVLGNVTLDDALKVFAPTRKPVNEPNPEQDEDQETSSRALNGPRMQGACADALLDNRQEELEHNASVLSEGLREALDASEGESGDDQWQADVTVAGKSRSFEGVVDRSFVAWIRHFCQANVWGGLIETTIPDLKRRWKTLTDQAR